jgi:aryl-alcohol dehydrogenase-like predicted oxidoreductase
MEGFAIATKVWPGMIHAHGEHLKPTFYESLKALQTEKVDIFYLHAPDYSTPFEETIRLVDELYREGRFERVIILITKPVHFSFYADSVHILTVSVLYAGTFV